MNPQETGARLLEMVRGARQLTIAAPFIKTSALERIISSLSTHPKISVFTRWRPEEIAAGVSDLGVLDLVESYGGTVLLHPLLHAKVYVTPSSAMVGSSNATLTGLGWAAVPSIETLHRVPSDDPVLESLFSVLEAASSRATKAVREAIARQAEEMKHVHIAPDISRPHLSESVSPFWIPRFNVPESVWEAYRGERSKAIEDLVLKDLAALGIPRGIEDENEFHALVGSALMQGFTGRLIQECAGLNAVDAADRLRSLLSSAGEETPQGMLGERYQSFARWVSFFVPNRTLKASGFSIV